MYRSYPYQSGGIAALALDPDPGFAGMTNGAALMGIKN